MTSIDMHLMGEVVHLHVTGPASAIPVTAEDLLRTVEAYIREGRVLVRAETPEFMTRFENLVYPPGTLANDDFLFYLSTIPVPRTSDLGIVPIALARKTPRLRKFLSELDDARYHKLYEINLGNGGYIEHWAWEKSVEEAIEDVAKNLQDLWSLRNYRVTARHR
ncbi:MAG: hypothetical protein Q6373_000945 [Candidatus Sigynarchaeota archaeon]